MRSFITAVLFAGAASAHTIFQQIGINGVMQTRYDFMRLPTYDGPITDVTATEMACNGGPNPLVMISPNVATVAAGSQITLQWSHTLDTDLSTGLVIDASHNGPVLVYMAKVSSATGAIPNSGWFKIYEDGYSNGQWAVAKLIANQGKVTVTIPSCIAPGDYLFRGELIALHAASSYPGAQLYMECAQLRVTGGGSTTPATYNIPGIYAGTDPGIKFNLYTTPVSYTIPGPAVFSCSGGSTTPASSSAAAVVSTTKTTTTAAAATTTAASSGTAVAQWGQCGGATYTGSTTCVSGSTCVKLNDYYSQCQ
ncbi:uncharacterized protein LAJ45_10773 [Morchella importuna]|uniref:AA9 family lytic polysaccharide monooxygenase n=1 Tax=Morchella conica CCBAS932 TaxID=1392247 RepID=A0A3N4KEU5_9PEZI|nr:uncharacterized protein LAJ45_10773 [Morchella importuna]KAH8145212.1 hypothetical protein LAJ45_10773 [Morchella importuna]RPB07879.1 hypothetical protein P167DRAFT_529410 [Morchella conica CCBAS932]